MKKLFSVLKYTSDYKGYTALNIIFNILFAVFSAATLALIKPFIELLFQTDNARLSEIYHKGAPAYGSSSLSDYFQHFSDYWLSSLIINNGKLSALVMICMAVFVLTVFKNIFRYLAMFFIAPIRNGVVRDLR